MAVNLEAVVAASIIDAEPPAIGRKDARVIHAEPNRTAYDLNFRLFSVPVRVHPLFWLIAGALGYQRIDRGRYDLLLVWIACVFVSILVHEFGHILAGRLFGQRGYVVLHSFGGLAIGSSDLPRRGQRIFVSFAGPLAGFILLGLVQAFKFALGGEASSRIAREALDDLYQINLYWGLLNLLPIWPLDGGHISAEIFTAFSPRNGLRMALQLSIAVAALLAINAVLVELGYSSFYLFGGGWFMALFFVYFAGSNYQALQQLPRGRNWEDERWERAPWERDPDEWKRR
jgi:Zn-dependent protease